MSARNIKLQGLDEIFSTAEMRQDGKRERVIELSSEELKPFKQHPFQAREDAELQKLVESIDRQYVECDLMELFNTVNEYNGDEMLKTTAYFCLSFENIHPFADGNRRVGRTLLNYYLLTHNHPPPIVCDEDKADYYAVLERFDAAEDIAPMLAFRFGRGKQ